LLESAASNPTTNAAELATDDTVILPEPLTLYPPKTTLPPSIILI